MTNYAFYRLPHHAQYVALRQTVGEPLTLSSISDINGRDGFVIAPFAASADSPLMLLCPDVVQTHNVPPVDTFTDCSISVNDDKTAYSHDFNTYHEMLRQGTFRKIVLARRADGEMSDVVAPETLFFRACHMYPRMFVALVSTRCCGTWLVATPEVLIEGSGDEWHTMALAGTMRLRTEQMDFDTSAAAAEGSNGIAWSDKNIQEQRYVATYITDCLDSLATDIVENGPRTTRAGNLVHLRSDFSFALRAGIGIGDVATALHPTPAVCGLPKSETRRFILEKEHAPRRYYSGFMGPVSSSADTHLYVTLRCMQIDGTSCQFYAGGGLLSDSVMEMEWEETQAKMETMKRCIATKKI